MATELHFGRAAKSLGISRQRLSATVIALEAERGTPLFVPGDGPKELTDAGTALLAEALAAIDAAAAVPEPDLDRELRVRFVPGVTVSKWTGIWAQRFPDIELQVAPVDQEHQVRSLWDGEADLCFVRFPIDGTGLDAIPLWEETPVVVVGKDHAAAAFDELTLADLTGETMLDASESGMAITLEMVAAGVGVSIVPHPLARLHARKDVVSRPVTDAPATRIALAWRHDAATAPNLEEFVGVVRGRTAHSSRAPIVAEKPTPTTTTKKPAPAAKKTAAKKTVAKRSAASKTGVKKPGANRSGGRKPRHR